MLRDCRGVESLPMMLTLSLMLAALTLGLGASYLQRAQVLASEQRALSDFEEFVLAVKQVSAGGVGSWRSVKLELPDGAIGLDGRLAQLRWKGDTKRAELLPLPVACDSYELEGGTYMLELQRGASGYLVKVSRVGGP